MKSGEAYGWLSESGYPSTKELKRISKWDFSDAQGCLDFVRSLWRYPDYASAKSRGDKKVYRFATGGWSGNESLISALEANAAIWGLCWESSHRGGRYYFSIPRKS